MLEYLPIGYGTDTGSSHMSMRINVFRYIINNHSDGSWFRSCDLNQFCAVMPRYAETARYVVNPRIAQLLYRTTKQHSCFDRKSNKGLYRVADLHAVKILLCKAERLHGIPESFPLLPPPQRTTSQIERAEWRKEKQLLRERKLREGDQSTSVRNTSDILFNLGR